MEILLRTTPEQQGINSQAISNFIDEANEVLQYLHSLTLVRHGQVIAEGWWKPFEPNDPHIMFSLSKSFCSTAVGFAVDEGLLKVTDAVTSFFADALPPVVSENLAAMQVRHLLSMSTGHAVDTLPLVLEPGVTSWARTILAAPIEYAPGTYFLYNTGATYLCSEIVQRLTGQTILEYLKPRLFEPLGIENPSWEVTPEGISTGGFGLGITTADIAKFGQLYLQKGVWNGQRLLSEEWVEMASSKQVNTSGHIPTPDWLAGYGFQFWRCQHNAYRADGAFGQYCIVMPEQDAVMALTSGLDMGGGALQRTLDLVWKHLLPAMQDAPLTENSAAHQDLQQKLANLVIAPYQGQAGSAVAAEVSGKQYAFGENFLNIRSVQFDFSQPDAAVVIETEAATDQFAIGNGTWQNGITHLNAGLPRKVAASGAWVGDQTFQLYLFFLTPVLQETPPCMTVRDMPFQLNFIFRFAGGKLYLTAQVNLAFAGPYQHQLESLA